LTEKNLNGLVFVEGLKLENVCHMKPVSEEPLILDASLDFGMRANVKMSEDSKTVEKIEGPTTFNLIG
jgi:hypothetical protein